MGQNFVTVQLLGVLAFLIEHDAFKETADLNIVLPLVIQHLIKILDSSSDRYKPGDLNFIRSQYMINVY